MRRLSLAGGVEKVGDRNVLLAAIIAAIEFFLSPQLSAPQHFCLPFICLNRRVNFSCRTCHTVTITRGQDPVYN